MAKLKMKKIELIALLTDSKKIIELLQRKGIVEICSNSDDELFKTNVTSVVNSFEKFKATAIQALEILDRYAPEKKSLADMLNGRTEIDKHDFGKGAMKLETIMNSASEIIRCNRSIIDFENTIAQLDVKCDTLREWIKLDVPLNFKGTASTSAFIGSVPFMISADEIEAKFPSGCSAEVISSSKEQTNIFLILSKDFEKEASEVLRAMSFIPISIKENMKPEELLHSYSTEKEKLEKSIEELKNKIIQLAENRQKLKFAVDYLQMRKDKYEALNDLGFTEKTFVLTGYIPEKHTLSLQKEIESKFTALITYSEPENGEDVPVLLENSSFSAPVEGITKMYALPSEKDVDPTPVMSFFYYLFFGMMLSDAGYGLLMLIGTTIALKKFKLETTMRKTLTMFRNCGISTIIWGALFGSWFGDIVQVVGREFFHKEIGSIALWFQPLDDPIKLLLYSFALGILHLFLGVAVSFRMTWKEGKKLDAFLDTIPVYLTVLGVAPLAAGILTNGSVVS